MDVLIDSYKGLVVELHDQYDSCPEIMNFLISVNPRLKDDDNFKILFPICYGIVHTETTIKNNQGR